MMNRIILIGVNQGVMIGGRFDGWLAQLTEAGWITIRKLEEADPYEALPDALRSSQSMELGAVGPATGPRQDQALHDAEARRRKFMANFPVINPEAFLSAPSALENGPAVLADATSNPPLSDLSSLRKGAEVMREALRKIAFLRPAGPTRNKLAMQMERIAIDALGGPGEAARSALVSGSREERDG